MLASATKACQAHALLHARRLRSPLLCLPVPLPVQMHALEQEHLAGDNQYACEFCCTKVDATRQMVLRSLPPYLCLALQRFVFDYTVRALQHLASAGLDHRHHTAAKAVAWSHLL